MKRSGTFLIFFLAALFIFSAHVSALLVEVYPKNIHQGDVFLVTVKGGKPLQSPSASFVKQNLIFSNCGYDRYCAIGAVDIKTKPGTYTVKVSVGKKGQNIRFSVKKTRFSKMRITLPEEKVSLSPENLEKIERENERLQEIFETVSDRRWEGCFILPLENDVSTAFGTKRILNNSIISVHRGVDIKGEKGENIKASNSGRVVLAEELFLGGNTIIIDHGQGLYTIYMHLSKFNVDRQESVSTGDVIGYVGSTGRSTGPHLHFGVKVRNINVNPFSLTKLKL